MKTIMICLLLLLGGCKQKQSYVEMEDKDGRVITNFDISSDPFPQETLRLSDWADDLRVVVLETTDQGLVEEGARYFAGDSCIVVFQSSGILLFDREGRFCRVIANSGRGPGEFQQIDGFAVEEGKELVFVIEGAKAGLVRCYHLNKPGYFRNIKLVEDDVYHCAVACVGEEKLLAVPFPYIRSKYLCYIQSFSGQLLDSIPWHFSDNSIHFGINIMYAFDDSFCYLSSQRDTVSEITPQGLVPRWIFRDINQKTYDILGETKRYLYFVQDVIKEKKVTEFGETVRMNRRKFCFDKEKRDLKCIESIQDDFLSGFDCQGNINFQQGRKIIVVYKAMHLMKYFEAEDGKQSNLKKWHELKRVITEENNPVLLIGTTK